MNHVSCYTFTLLTVYGSIIVVWNSSAFNTLNLCFVSFEVWCSINFHFLSDVFMRRHFAITLPLFTRSVTIWVNLDVTCCYLTSPSPPFVFFRAGRDAIIDQVRQMLTKEVRSTGLRQVTRCPPIKKNKKGTRFPKCPPRARRINKGALFMQPHRCLRGHFEIHPEFHGITTNWSHLQITDCCMSVSHVTFGIHPLTHVFYQQKENSSAAFKWRHFLSRLKPTNILIFNLFIYLFFIFPYFQGKLLYCQLIISSKNLEQKDRKTQ